MEDGRSGQPVELATQTIGEAGDGRRYGEADDGRRSVGEAGGRRSGKLVKLHSRSSCLR